MRSDFISSRDFLSVLRVGAWCMEQGLSETWTATTRRLPLTAARALRTPWPGSLSARFLFSGEGCTDTAESVSLVVGGRSEQLFVVVVVANYAVALCVCGPRVDGCSAVVLLTLFDTST